MARRSLLREFFQFVWEEKMWWMIPLLGVGAVIALLMTASSNPITAPFVYPIF